MYQRTKLWLHFNHSISLGPCDETEMMCDNGDCIPLTYRCDGEDDCVGDDVPSDEAMCGE